MRKWIVLLGLLAVIVMLNCGEVQAAEKAAEDNVNITFEELNDEEVFIKQSRRGTCTLASAAMIIRRAAMLSGNEDWASITESSVGSCAWQEGVGISWVFTHAGVTMEHDYVSSTEELKQLLEEHPEGIVAYDTWTPHAIALTDYDEEEDIFYCIDPSEACPSGRIPVSEAMIDIEDVSVVWYVTSPSGLSVAEEDSVQIRGISDHPLLSLDKTDFMLHENIPAAE